MADTNRIILHGALRKKFGKQFDISASTPARGLRALILLKPGFREAISAGHYRVVRGPIKTGVDLDYPQLSLRLGAGNELHVIPVAAGSKRGVGKIIIGALIVVAAVTAAFVFAPAGAGIGATLGASVGGVSWLPSYGAIALIGAGMLLQGISTALSQQPTRATSSYLINGQLNVTQQGVPVPVVYGRKVRVGSVLASAQYTAEDYKSSALPTSGVPPKWDILTGNSGAAGSGVGGGKSGGGGGGGAHQMPTTLQSKAIVTFLEVLSEGAIGGLIDGPKSIFFNNVPLMAVDGQWNFHGVKWQVQLGMPEQDPLPGFPAASQLINVGVRCFHATPVTRSITSTTANRAAITIEIPVMYQQDATNGDINEAPPLDYHIDVKPTNGPAAGQVTRAITEHITGGLCTSPYQRSYSFPLPNSGANNGNATVWEVSITRDTADSDQTNLQNDLYWSTLSAITDHQVMYSDTAYIAVSVDSEAFGSQIPSRTYEVEGIHVRVPLNYDPGTRTYATSGPGTSGGIWDGVSWQRAATDNPAWCFFDMLSNPRYGLGFEDSLLEAAAMDLYPIGQYCDQLVDDGFGSPEPRYSFNGVLGTSADAWRVMQAFASTFRGMIWWGAGQVAISQDRPSAPVKLVTQANVLNGMFTYEGTDVASRHTVARISWNDPATNYQLAYELAEDMNALSQRGSVIADITGFGVTSRGLAHRIGKWLLFTDYFQTETVTYQCGLDQIDLRPGEIIKVADPWYAGVRQGGRIRSGATVGQVALDTKVTVEPGQGYHISIAMPNGTLADFVPVSSFADEDDHTVVKLATALPGIPQTNAVFILTSLDLKARQFQVLGVSERARGLFEVTAVLYYPGKFDAVEKGIALDQTGYSKLPGELVAPLPPPRDVSAIDFMSGAGTTAVITVIVSWTAPNDSRIDHYQISAAASALNSIRYFVAPSAPSYTIYNLSVDEYIFGVRSVGRDGQTSAWAYSETVLVDGHMDPPDAPEGFTAVGGIHLVHLSWQSVPQLRILGYEIWRASNASATPGSGATKLTMVSSLTYTDNDADVLLPLTTWYYWVRAITQSLVNGAFAGPASATTSILIADDIADGILDTAKFAQTLVTIKLVDALPGPGTLNQIIFNTTDGKLYKWNGTAWVSLIDDMAPDLSQMTGQLTSDQIQSLAAAKIAGQLSDFQIASLNAAKLAGQITSTQIADNSISTPKLTAGAVTANKIAAQTITGSQIQAGSIGGDRIAGNSITGYNILGQTITADKIVTNSITGYQIAAATLTAYHLAVNSVTAGAITAGAVGADEIAANQIHAYHLAAETIIAQSFQLGVGVIDSVRIGNLQVKTANISGYAVTGQGANYVGGGGNTGATVAMQTIGPGMYIAGYASASPGASDAVIDLYRDQTRILRLVEHTGGIDGTVTPFIASDSVSPGYHVYQLRAALYVPNGFRESFLYCVEFKK